MNIEFLKKQGGIFAGRRGKIILLCLLVGVLLIAISALGGRDASTSDGSAEISTEQYKKKLEGELAELCSKVSGAGKCVVNVSFSEGERKEYRGSLLISTTPPSVSGITVLAAGADSAKVRGEISSMLSALYGIGQNRICVLKLS